MIFKTVIQLKKYCQLAGNPQMEALTASLRMTDNSYIIPILGITLYKELDSAVAGADANETGLSDRLKDLLHQCRMISGPMFCYTHADKADVIFSDTGMKRSESGDSKTAYQEQRSKFKDANLLEGEAAMELLIQFLEEKKAVYPTWTSSDNFKRYRSLFIKSGAEFNENFTCSTPYRNFWAMRSKMMDIEENSIRKFLGDEIFDALKAKNVLTDPGFTEKEKTLLIKIKKAIAYLTVAAAAPVLNVRITGTDLSVRAAASFSTNDNDNVRAGMTDTALELLIRSCNSTGKEWLNNADRYLNKNKTDFLSWIGFKAETDDDDCINGTGGAFGMC